MRMRTRLLALVASLSTALLSPVCGPYTMSNGDQYICSKDLSPNCIQVIPSGTPGAFKPAPKR